MGCGAARRAPACCICTAAGLSHQHHSTPPVPHSNLHSKAKAAAQSTKRFLRGLCDCDIALFIKVGGTVEAVLLRKKTKGLAAARKTAALEGVQQALRAATAMLRPGVRDAVINIATLARRCLGAGVSAGTGPFGCWHACVGLFHSCPVQQMKAGPRGLHCHYRSELPHLPPTLCAAVEASQRNRVLPDECATAVLAVTEAYEDADRCLEAMAEHSQVGLARLLGRRAGSSSRMRVQRRCRPPSPVTMRIHPPSGHSCPAEHPCCDI